MRIHTTLRMLAVAGAMATASTADAQETWNWNSAMSPGQTLEIRGINGGITAVAAGSGEARVSVTKNGRRSNPRDVVMEVIQHERGVTICAVYPQGRSRQANECRPGPGGRMNVENNDVEVEWTVRVPNGVRLVAITVNGGIEATNLPADVNARTVNGDVRLSTVGVARAATVNGSIEATLGRADWSGAISLESVNGSITAFMPAASNTVVNASTVTGSIETDFPLTVAGRFGGRRISGTVGTGGRELELKTVNGSITLRRR
jgi:cytoskeletal protein CcmA (bactofilin family)